MNDYMLRMMRIRAEEMRREARQARLAAGIRRVARQAAPAVPPAHGPVIRLPRWLAMAAARMRPTAEGR
jgi:hypothetical protein